MIKVASRHKRDLCEIPCSQSELSRAKTVLSDGGVSADTSEEEKLFAAERIWSGGKGALRKSRKGYTIVETMIFLAISGALLLSAMLLIGGQQRKTQFTTTVREFDAKLQSVISNVATGYYNNTGNTLCTAPGGVITVTNLGSNSSGQNAACTFIGQVIVPSTARDKVTIYSTAGLRRTGVPPNETEVANMVDAKPYLISATAEDYRFNAGLKISMKNLSTPGPIGSLGIFTTFNQYSGSSLSSGSTRSDLYAINSSTPGNLSMPGTIENDLVISNYAINPQKGIEVCLTDGTQYAAIVLNNGSTRTTIGNGGSCP